jgi:hypothetical protein
MNAVRRRHIGADEARTVTISLPQGEYDGRLVLTLFN